VVGGSSRSPHHYFYLTAESIQILVHHTGSKRWTRRCVSVAMPPCDDVENVQMSSPMPRITFSGGRFTLAITCATARRHGGRNHDNRFGC
jgi:hypothetical protein